MTVNAAIVSALGSQARTPSKLIPLESEITINSRTNTVKGGRNFTYLFLRAPFPSSISCFMISTKVCPQP